jgi:hypothetical protein
MPPRARQESEPVGQSTALAIPDDVRADLLRAQQGMVSERQRLVMVKIMAAGAGLFEFKDTNETAREFNGVILGSHKRNVLWDTLYGTDAAPSADGEAKQPACKSHNGIMGIPRQGFAHAALQPREGGATVLATGAEQISCAQCPYNKWGSKSLIPALMRPGDSGKGKAVTNQIAVYVLVPGRETPVQLILPPTSITAYDEYIASMTNHGKPVQAVFTTFKQEIKRRGQMAWAQAIFSEGESLGNDAFAKVLDVRSRFIETITGVVETLEDEPDESGARGSAMPQAARAEVAAEEEDDEIPF